MRTRFLDVNYSIPSPFQALESLKFLYLPAPQFDSNLLISLDDLLRFDTVPEDSLQFEKFPIDSALSEFFRDVLPQPVDVDIGDVVNDVLSPSREAHANPRNSDIEGADDRFSEPLEEEAWNFSKEKEKKEYGTAVDQKTTARIGILQFETPQLELLDSFVTVEKEAMQTDMNRPEIELNMGTLDHGLTIYYPHDIEEAVYCVKYIASESYIDQNALLVEDDSFQDQKQFHQIKFPSLEIDEISLGTMTCVSAEDALRSYFENDESQQSIGNDKIIFCGEENWVSNKYDTEEFLSDYCLRRLYLDSELDFFYPIHVLDLISIEISLQFQGNSTFYRQLDGELTVNHAYFEEFQMLDLGLTQLFEIFLETQMLDKPETSDHLFSENMKFKNFNELVIDNELTLVDDTFKSMPVPTLLDEGKSKSFFMNIEDMLANLQEVAISASDGIYLDWHLLEEERCASSQTLLKEIDSCIVDLNKESYTSECSVYDYLLDDVFIRPNTEENEEMKVCISDGTSLITYQDMQVENFLNQGHMAKSNQGEIAIQNNDGALLQSKSVAQFNDLGLFFNGPKASSGRVKTESASNAVELNSAFEKVQCEDPKAVNIYWPGVLKLNSWDIVFHKVKLSDDILAFVNTYEKIYLAILRDETELIQRYFPFVTQDNHKMLRLPKQKFMNCIKIECSQGTRAYGDKNIITLVTLYAIKQMIWYMCFYGIHPAYLYLDKLCKSSEWFKSKLGLIQSLIGETYGKLNQQITTSHPALFLIQKILDSKSTNHNFKVLIVAEKVFWWSLKNLLLSLGFSFKELNYPIDVPQQVSDIKFANCKVDDLLVADCLLVSHECIFESFPFNKFSIILEYGHSHASQVSSLSPKLVALPYLHFLTLELDDKSASNSFCEGFGMPQNAETITGKQKCFHSVKCRETLSSNEPINSRDHGYKKCIFKEKLICQMSLVQEVKSSILTMDENMIDEKLEKLLNFIPLTEKHYSAEAADCVLTDSFSLPISSASYMVKSHDQSMASSSRIVIIVNTKNCDKEMIIYRRSSYQKILAIEKEGAQVVERDSNLPMDLIITPKICLVWYDRRNIGKMANTPDEASSCLSLCIENIATDVLTSLSFTFDGCFLIFEGEISFLSIVMESSDVLYAAAASLGIHLQIFCSYTPELTDEIILSCIGCLTKGLYSNMPESETLAESFLTKFPSVNPLTAHAILFSGVCLIEFLELSHECRLGAIKQFDIPEESLFLFSVLCKYGEREDSKSIMTDSSSVSSGPNSELCKLNGSSGRKRRKYRDNSSNNTSTSEFVDYNVFKPFTGGIQDPSSLSKLNDSLNIKDSEIFHEFKEFNNSLNDLCAQKQVFESLKADIMMDPFKISKVHDTSTSRHSHMSNEIKRPCLFSVDESLRQNELFVTSMMKKLNGKNAANSDNQVGDLEGEVIHLTGSPVSTNEFSLASSLSFSPLMLDVGNDMTRKSQASRRLSFGKDNDPTFPMEKINSVNICNISKQRQNSSKDLANVHPDSDFQNISSPFYCENLLEECSSQKSTGVLEGLTFQSKERLDSGRTLLSNALLSDRLQKNSPWTLEFLNRIREKSKMRRQSLPCASTVPCRGYLGTGTGTVSKASKRRSPSILEFFKYQGGGNMKIPEEKRQKQLKNPSRASKNEISSTGLLPTWTPIDKRSRQVKPKRSLSGAPKIMV